jgi:alpha amylase catalytic region
VKKINRWILLIAALILSIFSCHNKNIKDFNNTEKSKIEKSGVYYEIFVRSYADSNNDKIGDIKGITDKLDELKELGIQGIWLTPIFKSPSYHKYDVTDYYTIDPEYGTKEDLKNLVSKAHSKGIKIILDLPVNHTSKEHPWFKDAVQNKDSKYKSYYRVAQNNDKSLNLNSYAMDHKSWNKLNNEEQYYAIFWEGMPDLNYSNKQVREEVKKIAKYWISEAKIDGYRIDGAYHIYGEGEYSEKVDLEKENINWWKEFRNSLEKEYPNIYIVGEVWNDTNKIAPYYTAFDSNFDFGISENGIAEAINSQDATIFSDKLSKIYETYRKVASNYIDAPFLTNHDQNRIANSLLDLKHQKLAASILLTLSGNPFIYYGEELGMKGSKPDEEIREPYLWGSEVGQTNWEEIKNNTNTPSLEVQKKNPDSLYNYYKKWIALRNENEALKYGDLKIVNVNDNQILAYKRTYKNKSIIVLHNLSDTEKNVNVDGKNVKISGLTSILVNAI